MKYVRLISKDYFGEIQGAVCLVTNGGTMKDKYVEVKILLPKLSGAVSRTFDANVRQITDITHIYDKIKKLIKAQDKAKIMGGYSPTTILENFENGKYPIKIEFEAMNIMWNQINRSK